jgi:transcriptional regulator with PAS, ATPase and Fis domain
MPPELSASELFGHEQGAFTGASKRRSPFEDAEGGTVFLDEVGDLQPITQGQLLRVIDEKRVKRLGSNTWQDANFRLVCATRMDLASMATEGRFRRDLYHRLAGHVVHLPPLRDRPEDVLPLVRHFLQKNSGTGKAPALDPRVESYLEERSYPGNVRELRDVTLEILARHAGSGPISMGAVPAAGLCDREFSGSSGDALEGACRRAISLGLSLQAIGRWAEDCALRLLLAENGGSIKKVAAKLNLTRRSLEKRRAAWRRNGQR